MSDDGGQGLDASQATGLAGAEAPEPPSRLGPTDGIPSAYGEPVSTVADLETLNEEEVVEGYRDGRNNEPQPTGNRSRSYWHGWRNGMADGGHMEIDAAMRALAHEVLAKRRSERTGA